jgi:Fe2+ or Zn2+ uptake regulation protein
VGKSNYPGEFEQVVMLALARVGDGAYSVPVHEEILTTSGRDVAIASVYVTLSRLENQGLVRSEEEPRETATGRPNESTRCDLERVVRAVTMRRLRSLQ